MRILLAGAGGVIGRSLTPLLVTAGHTVFGTSRRPERMHQIAVSGATPLTMDAFDERSVAAAFARAEPEAVLHQLTDLATLDFGGNTRLRIEGTRNLLKAARAAGVQRVVAESISWVTAPGSEPADESDPLGADAAPGVRELEDAVLRFSEGVVLRNGELYGEGTWYAPDGLHADQARAGELRPLSRIVSFVHVDDAARAVLDALQWAPGVYNIVDDEPAQADEWMPVFAAAVGAPVPVVPDDLPAGRPISNAKARAAGWVPRHPNWRPGLGR